jgi:hypothetical protein
MKNTMTISEAKIAICEKFLKDMSKMYHMEKKDTFLKKSIPDYTVHMILEVEKMLDELNKQGA